MKYIVYWEWNERDTVGLIKKSREIDELRKENPERFPTTLSGGSLVIVGDPEQPRSGISLYEANKEQMEKWQEFYRPELKVTKIVELVTAHEYIKELESKM